MALTDEQQALIDAAAAARGNAYARYSGFAVGSAVRTLGGAVFAGCNVENASYGLTACAERNAISAAVAGGMQAGGLAAIAVVGDADPVVTPCGACRQVIAEFASPGCEVVCASASGSSRIMRIEELLPDGFSLPED